MEDQYDAWDAAQNAKEPPREYFGLIELDVWPCTLVKGYGKQPFDPQVDKVEDRRTAVKVIATPLPSANVTFTTERDMIAEFGDWPKVTLKSIHMLNITPKDLHGKWARYELVPTRTYTNKDGIEKTATAFSFKAVYNSEAEAEAAAAAFYSGNNGDGETPAAPPANDKEREMALAFLKPLALQAGGDLAQLAVLIASNPIVAKYFNSDSPEVLALVGEATPTAF